MSLSTDNYDELFYICHNFIRLKSLQFKKSFLKAFKNLMKMTKMISEYIFFAKII